MKNFFHASRDIKFLRSFLREGAKAIGKGVGGQKTGFYVYENEKLAKEHFDFFKMNGGILVGVKVEEKNLKYPEWQFDYEANADVLCLLEKYSPFVIDILEKVRFKNFKIKSAQKTHRYGRFGIDIDQGDKSIQKTISTADPGVTMFTKVWQKVFDNLCQNPFFKKEYNALLADSPYSCKKYVGKTPLPVSFLSYIQPTKDGKYKETILYTDEKPKEQQVCPFLKAHLAQMSSLKKESSGR